ncbi:Serine hydrolase [Wickerhamomyces ciferrii]|uniref:Serine hydrolase n=1 Tax=Wickerhamomyces ciferrii (strain ATCC 14091 / BCRC 22168 / CBS 111 / JCM 3599 / NBRC 0793 / NRRL Y-1031 F-60-10) TaxID=1206466 RepID=K0KWP2_WICCF|nr:Serine hydrolase [Wickerhamomyces ciferrii]CCH45914.1 Serine hydrolase [Wickerhamomyces ciferrii]
MKILPNHIMDTQLNKDFMTSDPEWSEYLLHEPVIPLLGSLKQIYDFLKSINDFHASKKFIDMIPFEDKKFVPVKGSRHSIALEKQDIYDGAKAELLEWLSKH